MSSKARLVVITKTNYKFYSEVDDEEEIRVSFDWLRDVLLQNPPRDVGYVEVSDALIPYNSIDSIYIDRRL